MARVVGRRSRQSKGDTGRKPYLRALLICFLAGAGQMGWIALPAGFVQPKEVDLGRLLYAAEPGSDSMYIAPYVPTPHEIVNRMLEIAGIGKGDVLYDLGSGDGRIVVAAAQKYGIKAVGFEIDPVLVKQAREHIKKAGLEHLAEIREQDIRTVDLSPASVLTLYLYPGANLRLRPAIRRQLKPGARVVSHDFGMGRWKPDGVEKIRDEAGHLRTIYLWRICDRGSPEP